MIRLRLQCTSDTLKTALNGIALETLDTEGDTIVIRCQRIHKMELLRRINTLGESVDDIVVREPSLEDVFLGYAG